MIYSKDKLLVLFCDDLCLFQIALQNVYLFFELLTHEIDFWDRTNLIIVDLAFLRQFVPILLKDL